MDEIKTWLKSNTPDFNAGVLLFAKHSRNKSLLHYFTRKGDVTMLKLRYELGKLANGAPAGQKILPQQRVTKANAGQPAEQKVIAERTTIDPEGKINPDDLPEHLRTLYYKNVADYKLLRGAHAAMAVAKTKNERKKFRKEITHLDDAIAKHWTLIDEWLATGKLPEEPGKQPAGTLTPQEVNTFRTYISRGLAEPGSITAGKRATIQERVTALLAGGQKFDEETITKLTALGFTVE
jgi:hypothetical protein